MESDTHQNKDVFDNFILFALNRGTQKLAKVTADMLLLKLNKKSDGVNNNAAIAQE